MTFDLNALIQNRSDDTYTLFETHLNAQLVGVLRTLKFDVNFVRGEGAHLYDGSGTRYLDLLSGFGVFACGRSHPTIVDALHQTLDARLAGLVQLNISLLAGLLAERLSAHMPWLEKAFFCNSGAEAVEGAVKFARYATGRSGVVYCDHAYHGLTYGALSLTADAMFRDGFGPFVSDCQVVPFNDLSALDAALAGKQIAAFIVEPIQGKGVNMPMDGYLQGAAEICRRTGTVFIVDEIQTGLGRTGKFLASEHWGVEPDIVTLAKSLSGGFVPVGAIMCRKAIFNAVFDRMDRAVVHGSTFSKNDMAMAAGLATLLALEEDRLVERAADLGERLIGDLRRSIGQSPFVAEVRGKGMMIGIEFKRPSPLKLKAAYQMIESARKGLFCQLLLGPLFREQHILAQVAGSELPVIKLLPPFVIDETDKTWIIDAFQHVLADAEHLGAIWGYGRALVDGAMKARRSGAA